MGKKIVLVVFGFTFTAGLFSCSATETNASQKGEDASQVKDGHPETTIPWVTPSDGSTGVDGAEIEVGLVKRRQWPADQALETLKDNVSLRKWPSGASVPFQAEAQQRSENGIVMRKLISIQPTNELAPDQWYSVEMSELPSGVEPTTRGGFVRSPNGEGWYSRFYLGAAPTVVGYKICESQEQEYTTIHAQLSEPAVMTSAAEKAFDIEAEGLSRGCEWLSADVPSGRDDFVETSTTVSMQCEPIEPDTNIQIQYNGGLTAAGEGEAEFVSVLGETTFGTNLSFEELPPGQAGCRRFPVWK